MVYITLSATYVTFEHFVNNVIE